MYQPDLALHTVRAALERLTLHPTVPPLAFAPEVTAHALKVSLPSSPDLVPLSDALERGDTEVTELDNPSVPILRVQNRGSRPVYLPFGTTLRGGNQNRMVSVPVVVDPKSEWEIAVSCVERRRWNRRNGGRFHAVSSAPASIKRQKLGRELRARRDGRIRSHDQQHLWQDVHERLCTEELRSPTEDLTESVEWHRERTDWRAEVRSAWQEASGLVVVRRDRLVGADAWTHRSIIDRELEEALFTYALDLGAPRVAPGMDESGARRALGLLHDPDDWRVRRSGDAALVDFTSGRRVSGTALVHGETLVHLGLVTA